ncbi:MAG: ABC transporter permease, partial [Chloroflexota bacterium]
LKNGELGPLPIIIGLIIISWYFTGQNPNFWTPQNFANLIVQMAGLTVIAYGVVFVLLLGEIDLSIGYVSGVCAVIMALLLRQPVAETLAFLPDVIEAPILSLWAEPQSWTPEWWIAAPFALLCVSIIGFVQGSIIAYLKVPSFVVTLAGLLAWNGVVLLLVGGSGTVILNSPFITNITRSVLTPMQGWLFVGVIVVVFVAREIYYYSVRAKTGLSNTPMIITLFRIVMISAISGVTVFIANIPRGNNEIQGLPVSAVIMIVLLAFFTFIATETRFGRFVYAVGGNEEAARRAGIKTNQIRVAVFTLSSFMAGLGGIILASRLNSVATNTGGGNLLLNAIAAAVIGGTSLFGGRGYVYSALLGAALIATLDNGMGLLGLSSGIKFIATGVVLLIAVVLDSFSRR